MQEFTKFRGVNRDQLDEVILALSEAEFEQLEQGWIDNVSQLIHDELTIPLGLGDDVDGSKLYCRLYRMSLDRSGGL